MSLVAVGEYELDCERSGSGPPLLAIIGMSGTFSHWNESFLELLRRDFEVIVYDHRGVGRSTRLDGPITIREMAADAAGLLSALEVDSAHVLGISMGGMIAQELALADPGRLRTLTLGCTYCGGPGSSLMSPQVMRRVVKARASGGRERAVRASWELNVSPRFAADDEAWARFRDIGLSRGVSLEVIARQGRAIVAHDTYARLGEIALPTLVLHGTADEVLPVQNGRLVAERIPDARLEIFEGVGHMFFWEVPERSAELLQGQLAAVHA
jgi:pimeloyl-ACP methyl ester carboxylesterase